MDREKILEALEVLKDVCTENGYNCTYCPLRGSGTDYRQECAVSSVGCPDQWEFNDEAWKAIKCQGD